ncbi:hypothetical protein [Streptomyces sp. NPDC091268]|uniref:hypothetical protein n=1 Tax=Streptomyces sp. NPDC091268 TaxID=3365979 RepID=UPI003810BDB8
MRVALLIGTLAEVESCQALYANTLAGLGHEVWVGSVNGLSARNDEIRAVGGLVDGPLKAGARIPGLPGGLTLADMDALWVLNHPQPSVQTEAWQLLWRLNARVPFVNDVTGILMLGNKTNLPVVVPAGHLPDTLVSNSYDEVCERYGQAPQADWVLKPTDADAGADVYVLQAHSSNNRVLMQSLTGNVALGDLLTKGGLGGFRARYCVLQEYVPHRSEKRVILAAGRPAAVLEHRLANGEHRGNTAHRATCTQTTLTGDEMRLCTTISESLARHGVRFAGLDLAYPYVFEANLVNPGGLEEIVALGLPDTTPQILRDLLAQTVTESPGVAA